MHNEKYENIKKGIMINSDKLKGNNICWIEVLEFDYNTKEAMNLIEEGVEL